MPAWGKVVLRDKRPSDVVSDYNWKTDPELSHLDANEPLRISFYNFSTDYAADLRRPEVRSHRFAIDTVDGVYIGNCMYYALDEMRGDVEVGIMIGDSRYWSKGYGTDAMNALLDHVFLNLPIYRVYLHTLDWNTRAQKSFMKCGFLPCGRLVRGMHRFIIMEVQRPRWDRLRVDRLAAAGKRGDAARDEQAPGASPPKPQPPRTAGRRAVRRLPRAAQ